MCGKAVNLGSIPGPAAKNVAVSPEQTPNFFPKQSERGLICAQIWLFRAILKIFQKAISFQLFHPYPDKPDFLSLWILALVQKRHKKFQYFEMKRFAALAFGF